MLSAIFDGTKVELIHLPEEQGRKCGGGEEIGRAGPGGWGLLSIWDARPWHSRRQFRRPRR